MILCCVAGLGVCVCVYGRERVGFRASCGSSLSEPGVGKLFTGETILAPTVNVVFCGHFVFCLKRQREVIGTEGKMDCLMSAGRINDERNVCLYIVPPCVAFWYEMHYINKV